MSPSSLSSLPNQEQEKQKETHLQRKKENLKTKKL